MHAIFNLKIDLKNEGPYEGSRAHGKNVDTCLRIAHCMYGDDAHVYQSQNNICILSRKLFIYISLIILN